MELGLTRLGLGWPAAFRPGRHITRSECSAEGRSAKGRGSACALNIPEATLVFQQPSVDPGNVAVIDGVQNWDVLFQ